MKRLEGKVALITGAARGMGRSHALTLAAEGADIVAFDLTADIAAVPYPLATADDLRETAEAVEAIGGRILTVTGDVRVQEDLDDAVAHGIERFGKIDVVIPNAGIWAIADFWEIDEEQWRQMFEVNTAGVWRTVKAVAPHLIEQRSGSVILISSVNGIEGARRYAHYVAAKHAVIGLMRAFGLELAEYGVRCNAICPGAIDTPILRWQGAYDMMAGAEGAGTPEHLDSGGRATHLLAGRGLLSPQAVSNAVLWLASEESADISGLEVVVDAGHRLMPGIDPGVIVESALAEGKA